MSRLLMTILLLMGLLPLFPQVPLPHHQRRLPLLTPVILLLPNIRLILPRHSVPLWMPWRPTDRHSGHALPLPTAFPAPRFLFSQTEPCVARQAIPCLCRNADRSAMARCACCMLPALVIAARARCATSVKN